MQSFDKTNVLNEKFNKLIIDVKNNTNKNNFPNVDLALGFLLNELKIRNDRILMITIISRLTGWTAHYFEQVRNNVLIRPDLKYDEKYDIGGKVVF